MVGWFEAVLPVASALLGTAGGFGASWLTQSRQDRRERVAREHERAAAAVARREEFELVHLVEMNQLLREHWGALLAFRMVLHHWHYMRDEAESCGAWVDDRYPPEEFHRWDSAAASVSAQIGFILADDVRTLVEAAYEGIQQCAHVSMEDVKDPIADRVEEKVEPAFAAIAARVREIYAGRESNEPR